MAVCAATGDTRRELSLPPCRQLLLELLRYRRWRCSVPGRLHSMGPAHAPLIAVMNSSRDLVTLLETSLVQDGFRVITHVSTLRRGVDDVLTFLEAQHPD